MSGRLKFRKRSCEGSQRRHFTLMKKQILVVTASALTAAVVMLNGTSTATAQQLQYEILGFPISPLQMSVLQPSARMREQQRLSRQRTMDASRRPNTMPRSAGLASQPH
jgi:hypothetical protein